MFSYVRIGNNDSGRVGIFKLHNLFNNVVKFVCFFGFVLVEITSSVVENNIEIILLNKSEQILRLGTWSLKS